MGKCSVTFCVFATAKHFIRPVPNKNLPVCSEEIRMLPNGEVEREQRATVQRSTVLPCHQATERENDLWSSRDGFLTCYGCILCFVINP